MLKFILIRSQVPLSVMDVLWALCVHQAHSISFDLQNNPGDEAHLPVLPMRKPRFSDFIHLHLPSDLQTVFPLTPPRVSSLLDVDDVPGSVLGPEDEITAMLTPSKAPGCLLRPRSTLLARGRAVVTQHLANTIALALFTR